MLRIAWERAARLITEKPVLHRSAARLSLEAPGERKVKKRSGRRKRTRVPAPQDAGIRAHYGTPWEPPADSVRKIEASRSMRFGRFVEEEDIAALEAKIGLLVPPDRRKQLRDALDLAFTVLGVGQHSASAAPPHEIRDRMEQVRDTAHRLLEHLGVTPSDADSEKWQPSGLNFNATVLTTLVDAAKGDRRGILTCTKAIGAIARFADLARRRAEEAIEKGEAGTSRVRRQDCGQMLTMIFSEMFGQQPTETIGGPWEKFVLWFFDRAGARVTPNAARDMLREVKRSSLK